MFIQTPCSPGEVIDKLTVLDIKLRKITDEGKLSNVRTEYTLLTDALQAAVTITPEIEALRKELEVINQSIWDSEDIVRAFWNDDEKFLEGARNSHHKNDERARLKRAINELLGSQIIEEKSHPTYEHKH